MTGLPGAERWCRRAGGLVEEEVGGRGAPRAEQGRHQAARLLHLQTAHSSLHFQIRELEVGEGAQDLYGVHSKLQTVKRIPGTYTACPPFCR
jgi:hypothetical protein